MVDYKMIYYLELLWRWYLLHEGVCVCSGNGRGKSEAISCCFINLYLLSDGEPAGVSARPLSLRPYDSNPI